MKHIITLLIAGLTLALIGCNDASIASGPAHGDFPGDTEETPTDTPPDGDPEGDDCTLTQGYWMNHEDAWPVSSLTLGGVSYAQDELLTFMGNGGDASLILAQQLIASLLNVESGAVPSAEVGDALTDADDWMATYMDGDGSLAYGTVVSSPEGQKAVGISVILDDFNNGLADTPHCDDDEPNDEPDDDYDGDI